MKAANIVMYTTVITITTTAMIMVQGRAGDGYCQPLPRFRSSIAPQKLKARLQTSAIQAIQAIPPIEAIGAIEAIVLIFIRATRDASRTRRGYGVESLAMPLGQPHGSFFFAGSGVCFEKFPP